MFLDKEKVYILIDKKTKEELGVVDYIESTKGLYQPRNFSVEIDNLDDIVMISVYHKDKLIQFINIDGVLSNIDGDKYDINDLEIKPF